MRNSRKSKTDDRGEGFLRLKRALLDLGDVILEATEVDRDHQAVGCCTAATILSVTICPPPSRFRSEPGLPVTQCLPHV